LCAIKDFPIDSTLIKKVMKSIFPESKLGMNYRALDIGRDLIRQYEN